MKNPYETMDNVPLIRIKQKQHMKAVAPLVKAGKHDEAKEQSELAKLAGDRLVALGKGRYEDKAARR